MNRNIFILIILFSSVFGKPSYCNAANLTFLPGDSILINKFSLQLNREYLRSTHTTVFKGFSAQVNYQFTRIFTVGIGYERTTCAFHPDNNWNLYQLKFAPVYLSQQIQIYQHYSFSFFTEIREGISFIKYNKEEFKTNPGFIYPVKEKGFYGYAGLGAGWNFTKNFGLKTAVGFKAYHLSTNAQDVNPHGINYQIGLSYSFCNREK